ncbi:MAG: homoserine dehydrogenase [Oscillospiraceae bacterium]|nr:homoserine dehydrogenase [Oscillospiraceae bacterium]
MVNIAILGFGVIGNGVADIISQNYNLIKRQINDDINIKYIVDIKDFTGHPMKNKIISDFNIVLNDSEILIVVEMIGGSARAYDYSIAALRAGKNVVTSNKEVVVKYGHELIKTANENNVRYLFEASVGGGIPIIRQFTTSFLGNDINEIVGILNGTTNYILTQMSEYGKSMEEALKEAQQKGYAEANPEADVSGMDTCRKICILAALAFGVMIPPENVDVTGIKNIKKAEKVKLLGRAKKINDKIQISVAPYIVNNNNPLANINDVYNGILIRGSAGDIMFYGQGAGAMPTASAVLSDIIDIILNKNCQPKQSVWIVDDSAKYYEPVLKETEFDLGLRL